jgi:hypothetical protein
MFSEEIFVGVGRAAWRELMARRNGTVESACLGKCDLLVDVFERPPVFMR